MPDKGTHPQFVSLLSDSSAIRDILSFLRSRCNALTRAPSYRLREGAPNLVIIQVESCHEAESSGEKKADSISMPIVPPFGEFAAYGVH